MANGVKAGNIFLDLKLNQKGFNTQLGGITNLAKKAGVAIAAAFSVKAIVQFGKECINLGSDLQEVQNVVDVAFPTMSKQIDAFATDAAKNFGLSETMAKRFSGTFGSMATAFGFTEKQAASMATTLTGLAGDVASFYNITQDEAYTKLKSVFTGETESLKDLGVVMTQTALDQYALANGFGKTTKSMSEQEKVALRYKFVQDQLTNAAGDFTRTSDSWANQVRVLSLNFDTLKASIGQGLINLLTPVVKWLNLVIEKLTVAAKAFANFTSMFKRSGNADAGIKSTAAGLSAAGVSADNLSDATGAASDNLSNATKNARELTRTLAGFDQITKVDKVSGSSSGGNVGASGLGNVDSYIADMESSSSSLADRLEEKYAPVFDRLKSGFTSVFKADIPELENNFQKIKDSMKAVWQSKEVDSARTDFHNKFIETLGAIDGGVASVAASWAVGFTGGVAKAKEELEGFNKTKLTSIYESLSDICDLAKGVADAFSTIAKAFESEAFKDIVSVLEKIANVVLLNALEKVVGFMKDLFEVAFKPIIANKAKIKEVFEKVLDVISKLLKPVSKILDKIADKSKKYEDTAVHKFFEQVTSDRTKNLSDFLDRVIDVLDELLEVMSSDRPLSKTMDMVFGWILGKRPSQIKVSVTTTFTAIREKAFDAAKTAWDSIKDTKVGKTITSIVLSEFTAGKALWDSIKDAKATKTLKNALATGFDTLKAKWDAFKDKTVTLSMKFSAAAADLKDWINTNVIDKINSKFAKVPILKNVKIPHLAQGGYVKANTPQLAVIGDNRHQGEIVSPEGKLEAMAKRAAELANTKGHDMEIINLLKQILLILQTLELVATIDGKSVKDLVVKLINEHTRATGICEVEI